MTKEIRKVVRGEPFKPSTAWQHGTVDAIRYVRQLQASGGAGSGTHPFVAGTILCKNKSGVDRNRFDVLGIDDWFPAPADNLNAWKAGPIVEGITPDSALHLGRFVILLAPAKANATVPAAIACETLAKVNVAAAGYRFADVKHGDAGALQGSSSGSARILRIEAGIGTKWALVRLGDAEGGGTVGVMLAQDHPGRKIPFNVWLGTWSPSAHDWIYDTSTTHKAIDLRYGVPYPLMCATGLAEARPSTTYGTIWEIVALDCESPGCSTSGSGS